jgi:hypothetical protein
MQIDVEKLDNNKLATLIDNRWNSSTDVWAEVEKAYKKNVAIWKSDDSSVATIPKRKSKVRDNRLFLAMESVIAALTARPSKPNVIPTNGKMESGQIALDLQELFLEMYKTLRTKKKIRRGLRWLLMSRMIVLKMIWDNDIDNFNVMVVDPRKVRFHKKATNSVETDFAIEEIDTNIPDMIARFPEQKEDILKQVAGKEEDHYINNTPAVYKEAWINGGEWVVYKFREKILKKERNPYWDWEGVYFTKNELRAYEKAEMPADKKKMVGLARRLRDKREKTAKNYQNYLLNHFDKPRHPYIFSSMLEVEEKPVGETSLMEQVNPLQKNINQRKRQIADNASMAQGRWKVDTKFLEGVSKAEIQAMKSDPEGIIYGDGVSNGITIETGRDLPTIVKEDLILSIQAIDALFGTQPTFRGEKEGAETATGRAILRDQSFQRLTELIDIVDEVHWEIYNWELQLIKINYTETHFTKILGRNRALRVIETMRDDVTDGIDVKVIPGQMLPKDRVYRAERAFEGLKGGFIIPLTYFEEAEFENPMETAKQLEMYKVSPFAVLDMNPEDIEKLRKGIALLQEVAQASQPPDERAQAIAQLREKIQEITQSEEFKNQPREKQQQILAQLKGQFEKLSEAQPAQGAKPAEKK